MENEMEDAFRMENKMESLEGCKMEQKWKTQCAFHFLSTPKNFDFLFKFLRIRPFCLPSWLGSGKSEWKKTWKATWESKTEWKTEWKDISLKWKHDEPTVGGLNFHNLKLSYHNTGINRVSLL